MSVLALVPTILTAIYAGAVVLILSMAVAHWILVALRVAHRGRGSDRHEVWSAVFPRR